MSIKNAMDQREPLIVEVPTLIFMLNQTRIMLQELRAAELVALSLEGRYDDFTVNEFDAFVHGGQMAHTSEDYQPETDEEWAGWLANIIDADEE